MTTSHYAKAMRAASASANRVDVGLAVDELARRVDAAYRRADYREEAFPDIAERMLRETELLESFSVADLYAWAVGLPDLPQQLDQGSTFGEPPLTLYWGKRFVVDAYTWFSSTTSIHQHAFTGAFGVLEGGSVHTTYGFVEEERINSRLQRGRLDVREVEFLRRGSVRAIRARREFIHSLFHLEHPSVSVVVRTQRDDEYNPKYSYLHPGISFDPFFMDRVNGRSDEILRALARVDPERYADVVADLVGGSDLATAFFMVLNAHRALLEHRQLFAQVQDRALSVHGKRLEPFVAALDRQVRDRHLTLLRKKITDPELRLFIALLLNVPTGDRILALLGARFPGTPAGRKATELTGALLEEASLGFSLDPLQMELFELALQKLPFERMLDEIKRSYDDDDVERARPTLTRFLSDLSKQPIVAPLFA